MQQPHRFTALDLLSYPRALFLMFFGAIWTVVLSVIVIVFTWATGRQKVADFIIQLWSRPLNWICGVEVELRGDQASWNTQKGFLILFNHSSLWDIPVLFAAFPRPFRYGAKVELFKIPFFGKAMEVCGVLPIDRGNRNKVMKVYENAIQRVNNGECFALAPEGTRQEDATQLGRFKRGPFEFAVNAQMNIVPVIIAGALDVLPKHSIWINAGRFKRKVIVEILPAISTANYTLESVEQLQERVWNEMNPVYQRLNRELAGTPV